MEKNLKKSLLFSGLDENFIENFLKQSKSILLKKGEYLWRENEVGNSMYLLEKGVLEVLLGPDEIVVSKIEKGAIIGEMSVFGQKNVLRLQKSLRTRNCTLSMALNFVSASKLKTWVIF